MFHEPAKEARKKVFIFTWPKNIQLKPAAAAAQKANDIAKIYLVGLRFRAPKNEGLKYQYNVQKIGGSPKNTRFLISKLVVLSFPFD